MIKVINMKCGYHDQPLSADRNNVCFSWNTQGGQNQKAYRLQIAHDPFFKSIHADTQKIVSQSNKFICIKSRLSKNSRYYWRVKIFGLGGNDAWSDVKFLETEHGKFDAKWITSKKKRDPISPAPSTRFRKEFTIKKDIKDAKLFASAQGVYVASINGNKCGTEYLSPGWTEYKSRIQYQIFNVKNHINIGTNCISSIVSDGWFMGPLQALDKNNGRCHFGNIRAFFAQLEITYQDGSKDIIVSDKSWYSDMKSAYTRCEIYYGADYDSCLEEDFEHIGSYNKANSQEISIVGSLVPPQGEPVENVTEITPIKLFKTKKNEIVLDMGQNMVGTIELNLKGRLGQEIELIFFEMLDKDGCVYTSNLCTARQGLKYVLKSGDNKFIPEMTFFGFRYIHIKKWPGEIVLDNIKGIVLSSINKRTGYLKTNNDTVNQLISNTIWGQIGNFLDVPTGCPQRDERLGFTGDAQIFIKAAAFNYDILSFFNKWLSDMALAQCKDGAIPNVVPDTLQDNESSAGWGESSVIIPWQIYIRYGDIDILNRCYPMMKLFLDYKLNKSNSKYLINNGLHFGDWLALDALFNTDSGLTPKDLIGTLYFGYIAKLMISIASVLEIKADVKKYTDLYKNIKETFSKEFVTSTGKLYGHTQTAYVLALEFDILADVSKKRAINELVKLIEEQKVITCGLLGSSHVLDVLTDNGHHDLAIKMALKTSYPSWLYSATMGTTTICERWDSILPDGTVNLKSMNSFNHYAYGAIANWYYEKIAGIIPDEKKPGYKHFYLHPRPCKELYNIEAKLTTHYGTIKISFDYNIENNHVFMSINIPDNSSSELTLEDCKTYEINEKRKRNKKKILLVPGKYSISYVKGGSMLSHISQDNYR